MSSSAAAPNPPSSSTGLGSMPESEGGAVAALPLTLSEGAGPPPPLPLLADTLGHPVTVSNAGDRYFLWDAFEIARLRTRGHMAITAIGSCAVKTSTRGKAAALPVMLSDEEVCVLVEAGWARVVDAAGADIPDISQRLAHVVAAAPFGQAALRRVAFRDLWLRGYCLTNGVKFGVDYLCYRDDPTAVHAAFMVVVLREGCGVRTLSLTAVARVATTALKIAVVAWVDPVSGSCRYAAFKRMGPGSAIFQDSNAAMAGEKRGGGGSGSGSGSGSGEAMDAPS